MIKLRECPTCGSVDVSHENFGYLRHTIICNTCGLSTDYTRDDDEATEAWNSRPGEDTLRGLLEAAKNALLSYQYGNSSPDLAEEIVAEIEKINESQK